MPNPQASKRRVRSKRLALLAALSFVGLGGALGAMYGYELGRMSGSSMAYTTLEPHLKTESERGAALFAFGDLGALTSDTLQVSASPWKLMVAALALEQADEDLSSLKEFDVAQTFRGFGFHSPERIENWPAGLPQPDLGTPLGQNVGMASHPVLPLSIAVGNIGCAACHSSVVYGLDGRPDPSRVWIGGANTSINLGAFTEATFRALRDQARDPDRLMNAVDRLFPGTGMPERQLLRWVILPRVQEQVAERDAQFGALLPYPAGVPGATNGLDSLRARLGLIPAGHRVPQSVFNSVPDLGDRLFRTMLLNTASYALPGHGPGEVVTAADIDAERRRALAGIIAYFTVPAMGLDPAAAEAAIDDVVAITTWLEDYEPQPFPGSVDDALLAAGRTVYAERCAACHGDYGPDPAYPELIVFPNWQGDVGTDSLRRELVTPDLVEAVNGSLFGRHIQARTATGYAAPPLTGLWSSAPYLHNGAVPTIWHLMHPEFRPRSFAVGGHALDFDRLGVELEPDASYEPWSRPVIIDTSAPGFSAAGHEAPFDVMSEREKEALLEYLKLL